MQKCEGSALEKVDRLPRVGTNLEMIEEFIKSGEKMMRVSYERTGHCNEKSLIAALYRSISRSEYKGRVKAVMRIKEIYLIRLD